MREFYICVDYLKELLGQDTNVHTVTHGLNSLMDIQKQNIFPLAHLQVLSFNNVGGSVVFNFEVAVVDKRNQSNTTSTNKFLSNDNDLDNLNTTYAVMNRLLFKIKNLQNDFNITLNNDPQGLPIIFKNTNLLDGWASEIELSIPNIEMNACID